MKLKPSRPAAARPTATAKQFLFAYAQLQRQGEPSNVVARGELRAREDAEEGMDGAAKFGGDYHGVVYGQRLPVSQVSLKYYDSIEAPEYKRKEIETSAGRAWAYEYVGKDFASLPPVPNGHFEEFRRDLGRQDEIQQQLKMAQAPAEEVEE